jgi:methionine-rich copper-binding protein CopC
MTTWMGDRKVPLVSSVRSPPAAGEAISKESPALTIHARHSMQINHRLIPFALLLAALLGYADLALAHSEVVRTSPQANANLQSAPRDVSILFNAKVEAARDAITVEDAAGARVDQGDTRVEGNGRVIRASLKPLTSGTYTVRWRVKSSDTHTVEGTFSFRVR